MGRPLRFAIPTEDLIHADRWAHAVAVRDTHLLPNQSQHPHIDPALVGWLRANVRRGEWRFTVSITRTESPFVNLAPGLVVYVLVDFAYHLRFTREDDAFAFKIAWG